MCEVCLSYPGFFGMDLRRRKPAEAAEPEASEASEVSALADTLKSMDVYPKTLDDFKERTHSGAIVSILSCSVIFMLIVSEFRAYMSPTMSDHLHVDTTRGERIRINLNVTFPRMPCAGMR